MQKLIRTARNIQQTLINQTKNRTAVNPRNSQGSQKLAFFLRKNRQTFIIRAAICAPARQTTLLIKHNKPVPISNKTKHLSLQKLRTATKTGPDRPLSLLRKKLPLHP
jgi:hypothetical protein